MKPLWRPIRANIEPVNRLRRLASEPAFSSANPSEMPKSIRFEFYLIKFTLEQNMNTVKLKNLLLTGAVASRRGDRPPASGRPDQPVPVEEGQPRQRPAGQECRISSISAPQQAPR